MLKRMYKINNSYIMYIVSKQINFTIITSSAYMAMNTIKTLVTSSVDLIRCSNEEGVYV